MFTNFQYNFMLASNLIRKSELDDIDLCDDEAKNRVLCPEQPVVIEIESGTGTVAGTR